MIIFLDLTLHRKDDNFEFGSYENGKQISLRKQFIIFHDTGYKIIALFFFPPTEWNPR
jgi:hypothetical protein